jgi:hypothetical protein
MRLINDLAYIDASQLRRFGCFKPNLRSNVTLDLLIDGIKIGEIDCFCAISYPNSYLSLHWQGVKKRIEQDIQLTSIPSNLRKFDPKTRKNRIYYFVCPITKLRCSKLFLAGSQFVSRHATDAKYFSQLNSKPNRKIISLLEMEQKAKEAIDLIGSSKIYRTYRGKISKSMKRAMAKAEKAMDQRRKKSEAFMTAMDTEIKKTKKGYTVIKRGPANASNSSDSPDWNLPEWDL